MIWSVSTRSEEHTSELQSHSDLVCRLLLESPGGHLDLHSFPTRRSSDLAPKVRPGDEDGGALGLGPVELECGIQAAVGPEAPIVEQGGTEAGALHPLQELLRNDLVGVHEIGRAHV